MGNERTRTIVSVSINIIIFVTMVASLIVGIIGDTTSVSEERTTGLAVFKFFTVQSNVLTGIVSAVFAGYGIAILKGRISKLPSVLYTIKLVLTVGVAITFLTVVFVLAPIAPKGYFSLFAGTNFFFHFAIPVLAVVVFVFFEPTDDIPLKQTAFGVLHMVLYGVFYMTVLFTHMENGRVPIKYDWYGFYQNGPVWYAIMLVLMVAFTYFICWLLWILNKKIATKKTK